MGMYQYFLRDDIFIRYHQSRERSDLYRQRRFGKRGQDPLRIDYPSACAM